ncbi:MAG: TonB-dependent receptor plug domain-containing protein [Rhizomicrobium sp.]
MSKSTSVSAVRRARDNASHFVLAGAALVAAGVLFVAPAYAADDAPIVLGPVKVEDKNGKNDQNHGTGLNVLPTTVQDTPQAINVIGAEEMRQQGVTSLEQALRNVPGITVSIGEGRHAGRRPVQDPRLRRQGRRLSRRPARLRRL